MQRLWKLLVEDSDLMGHLQVRYILDIYNLICKDFFLEGGEHRISHP